MTEGTQENTVDDGAPCERPDDKIIKEELADGFSRGVGTYARCQIYTIYMCYTKGTSG